MKYMKCPELIANLLPLAHRNQGVMIVGPGIADRVHLFPIQAAN